jgi:hypothetical protein
MIHEPETKVLYRQRQKRQLLVLVPIVPTVFLLLMDKYNHTQLVHPAILCAVIFACLIFSFFNWRCPGCNKYLGRSLAPSFCGGCGMELSGK